MKSEETLPGQQESQQPTRDERMQSMLGLSTKFGGSTKIPEENLTAIGYVRRAQEDGTVRLMPHERMLELAEKDPNWEKPIKEREHPFGRIGIELPTAEHSFALYLINKEISFQINYRL